MGDEEKFEYGGTILTRDEAMRMIWEEWNHAEDTFPYLDKRRQADGKFRVVRVHNNINRPEVLGKDLTIREANAFMKMLKEEE